MLIKKIRFFQVISLLILFTVAVLSGYRIGGLDYYQYVSMIKNIQTVDGLFSKILIAKDPMFGIVVSLVNPLRPDAYVNVFTVVAMLAFLTKLSFIWELKRAVIFSVLYFILIAPSLDFAAIRAMLGVFFLIGFLKFYSQRSFILAFIFGFFSVISHVSMALPILLSLGFVKGVYDWNRYLFVFLFFLFGFLSKPLFALFKNTSTYIEVGGTYLAFVPVLLLIINLLVYSQLVKNERNTNFNNLVFYLVIILTVFSLAMLHNVVIIGMRYMQIAQVLLLVALCSANFRMTYNKFLLWVISFVIFCIPLIYRNVSLNLWSEMLKSINL